MTKYRYTECGLDNVIIEGIELMTTNEDGEACVSVPNINALHKAIALGLLKKPTGLTGRELRFLRTEMGMTQAELATIVHREPLAVSRWERGEVDAIDSNAETLMRLHAAEMLGLEIDASIREIAGWSVPSAIETPLVIDGSDPDNYRPKLAA